MNLARRMLASACLASLVAAAAAQVDGGRSETDVWRSVVELATPTTQPADDAFAQAVETRQRLLEAVRLYSRLYPGGPHSTEAVQRELTAMFELAVLRNEPLTETQSRAARYADGAYSEEIRAEGAYWRMFCDLRLAAADEPPVREAGRLSPRAVSAYGAYIEAHPHSPHVVRLAAELFADADRRDDIDEMRRLAGRLRAAFPKAAQADRLDARLRLRTAIGEPFPLRFTEDPQDAPFDLTPYRGRPLLIIVWADAEPTTLALLEAIEAHRRESSAFEVIGVNTDASREPLRLATSVVDVHWRQVSDGKGRATWFARRWAVPTTPYVFAVAADGVLIGHAPASDWRRLADLAATAGTAPTTTAPTATSPNTPSSSPSQD